MVLTEMSRLTVNKLCYWCLKFACGFCKFRAASSISYEEWALLMLALGLLLSCSWCCWDLSCSLLRQMPILMSLHPKCDTLYLPSGNCLYMTSYTYTTHLANRWLIVTVPRLTWLGKSGQMVLVAVMMHKADVLRWTAWRNWSNSETFQLDTAQLIQLMFLHDVSGVSNHKFKWLSTGRRKLQKCRFMTEYKYQHESMTESNIITSRWFQFNKRKSNDR